MKYSVVIPVYNSTFFLEECVESVLSQSSDSECEILLIDDGSTDGSGLLCDQLAKRSENIRVIHQKNQGVSAARNTGIAAAQGQYILFLDADDLWDKDLLCRLDEVVVKNPDLIQFGFRMLYKDGHVEDKLPPLTEDGESGARYLERLFSRYQLPAGACWNTAYRTTFLRQQELLFPVGVRYGEDLDFRMRNLALAQQVYGLNMPLYFYRIHGESVTHTLSLEKLRDHLTVCSQLCRKFSAPVLADYYCIRILHLARLPRSAAKALRPLLLKNRDLLKLCKGTSPRIARILFRLLGWYNGAKLMQFMVYLKSGE